MKRIILLRHHQTDKATYGTLMVHDGVNVNFQSVCLELPWKDNQARISCIPAGSYEIVLEYSPAFNTDLWEIKGVPGRSECKIHAANYAYQLNGCIAPGRDFGDINQDGIVDVTQSGGTLIRFHAALHGLKKCQILVIDADV